MNPTPDQILAGEISRLTEENASLRSIFPDILTALANGAKCIPTVSLDFMRHIPKEVSLVTRQLRADLAEKDSETQTLRANAVRDQSLIDSLGQRAESAESRIKWLANQPAVSLWWGTAAATGARVHDICAMTLDGGTVLENIGTGPTLAAAIDDAMAREAP